MLDAKGLEAGARQEATWDGRDFDALGSADRSRYLGRFADGVTAYLQAVGPEPAVSAQTLIQSEIDRLRPHYQSMTATDAGRRQILDHFEKFTRSALVAPPPAAPVVEALPLREIRRRVRNIWGAISSNQVIDKDVEGQAKRLLADIDAALAAKDGRS